jgi:hypothetical protein
MKRTALVLGGILSLGLVATTFAQTTTNVYSKNAVGYVSQVFSPGFTLASVQLSGSDTPLTIDNVFGQSLPPDSRLYFFTPPSGPYALYLYYGAPYNGWYDEYDNPSGSIPVPRGIGFWVKVPSATNVSVVGEVPSAQTAATSGVDVVNGFTLFSYPYPVNRALTNSVFNTSANDGDRIYAWDGSGYKLYLYYGAPYNGWYDEYDNPADLILEVGKSYWYKSGAARRINETKPYLWP